MSEINSYLTFTVGSNYFGVDVDHVVEILEFLPLKSKPESLPYILGLIDYRGQVIPLIDTGMKFGQSQIEVGEHTCIVVINVHDQAAKRDFQVAVLADLVTDVINAADLQIQPIESNYKPGYIRGALKDADNLVLVMDVDKIFTDTDVVLLHELVNEDATI